MSRAPLAAHAAHCDARDAMMCEVEAPGHAVYAMQERVAAATARQWHDAIVTAVRANGTIVAHDLEGAELTLWRHDASAVEVGEPIAVHRLASLAVLAGRRLSADIR